MAAIVAAVYIREPLSVTNTVLNDFNDLLGIRRKSSESFQNFEARFAAKVAKYHCHGTTRQLHGSIFAMMLLSTSNIDDTQRIPILSSAGAGVIIQWTDFGDEIVTQITYENIASISRQCDTRHNNVQQSNNETYVANTAYATNRGNRRNSINYNGGQHRNNNNLNTIHGRLLVTTDDFKAYKLKPKCTFYGNHGHWATDHSQDGSSKHYVRLITPTGRTQHQNQVQPQTPNGVQPAHQQLNPGQNVNGQVRTFITNMVDNTANSNPKISSGPLIDNGSPYSSIGLTVLRSLPHEDASFSIQFDPKPSALSNHVWWQFGTGAHSSARRKRLSSINISCASDNANTVLIRHLIFSGSSQRVITRNVTRASDVLHCSSI